MDDIFSNLTLINVHNDLIRNIVSLRESQDLFDDLSDNASEWRIAQQIEDEVKPHLYRSNTPVIHRPFEDALWFNAVAYPFTNWQVSRFSDGTFGVWYGSNKVETTIYETAYHWYRGLICDAGYEKEDIVILERKIYNVFCDAALLNFKPLIKMHPELIDKKDYRLSHMLGARIHHEGHPGLLTYSARCNRGENYVVFNQNILSNPRYQYTLTYRLQEHRIQIEKVPGTVWMEFSASDL